MRQEDQLQEMTEEFLLSMLSEISGNAIDASKCSSPFQELGIDSFHVLQVVKKLEAHFGSLSKTLLFENFTIRDLAKYFVQNHKPKLMEKFRIGTPAESPKPSAPAPSIPTEPARPKADTGNVRPPSSQASQASEASGAGRRPILILEQDALAHPRIGPLVSKLFQAHKNEGSVSRGTRVIAPNLFLGGAQRGFFNYGRSGDILLAYAYTGPEDYFPELALELIRHCREKHLELSLFTDNRIEAIGGIPFTATPFGAVQRIHDLGQFSLQGGKMRRLRYQVSKFEEKGPCRTEEYRCGTDKETDRQIADIIDRWCSGKAMINPLIHTVKREVLDGKLTGDHRVFLTYLKDELQNAILISPMSHEARSYLMDLEFYPKEMPLGGLESAIARIVETLVKEGCQMLSLGATFGVKIAPSENADPGIEAILDRLREQNLFNDDGNLQFKNKFRTENKSIFLCRPVEGSNPDNVTDIILMIADPGRTQIPDTENHTPIGEPQAAASIAVPAAGPSRGPENASGELVTLEGKTRSAVLADAGFNPHNIPASLIEFDLRTDSWSQLESPFVRKQMRYLQAHVQQPADALQSLKQVFPFQYLSLAQSGRAAERAFYQAWERKGEILENPLFPTTIFHQIDGGFAPKELAHPGMFASDCTAFYRGELDWDLLQGKLDRDSGSIAMVCVELSDNGAGGYPVSLEHLRKVRALLDRYAIPLVLDGTRILENALCEGKAGAEDRAGGMWETARELCRTAHAVVASLTKDFCIAKGGVIATDDPVLYGKIESIIGREGLGLDLVEKRQIGLALRNAGQIEIRVKQRMENVRLLWDAWTAVGVPLLRPAGTHCVVIDVQRMEEFRELPFPVASFLAWLFLTTGIRAGALSTGMKKTPASSGLVRLTVPVGMSRKETEETAARLASAFRKKTDIPVLAADAETPTAFGDLHTRYGLQRFIDPSSAIVSRAHWDIPAQRPAAIEVPAEKTASERASRPGMVASRPGMVVEGPTIPDDIAVIGMAGRYPKAANLAELWENLLQRKDCIEELPQARLAQRQAGAKKYRGGFLADIDRFDSLFFNISPREAEIMDPQERLFLEVVWETLEDGGYFPEALGTDGSGRNVGVFVGAVWTMYQVLSAENNRSAAEPVHANSFLWSIANRVSYWMNFTGPSLTLDTACSSSLTALHLACEALKRGDCSSAIVGGVNLDLHQHKFDINWGGGALSKDGVCRSFGKGANGYVAGEGIGAILLKPLQAAIRDRDNIHGIIKGVTVNHGGKTGGYTVPSPNTQAELIATALRKARIDARSIGYVEAHGTGTALGDPIEISGLKKAFDAYGVAPGSCAIGSVKTNIGHLEAAAGIAGISKALLQMKHRKLVPSLHSGELNEHIDFAQTPFYVEQEIEEFQGKEVDAVHCPLRSGISSFGAGGANAHVILEEFPVLPAVDPDEEAETPFLFPLSARSEPQLAAMAKRLCDSIQKDLAAGDPLRKIGIQDIAYTLQMGRKSFDFRLAILAGSKRELAAKLESFLSGKPDRQILAGRIKANEGIVKLLNREEREEFVRMVTKNGDPQKLAQIWVEGLIHSWPTLETGKGRRISLPTYPFADERHWIRRAAGLPSNPSAQAAAIHPLVHRNESDLYQQRYASEFAGGESVLSTLVIRERSFLSPLMYLEMAGAALLHATSAAAGDIRQRLKNLAWNGFLPGGTAARMAIRLGESDGGLGWEIQDQQAENAPLHWGEAEIGPLPPGKKIDLASLGGNMEASPLARESLARHLAEWGLEFGKASQCVTAMVHQGDRLLATLQVPEAPGGTGFLLNPNLLEGALQSALWLLSSRGHSSRMPLLPTAIACVDIYARIPDQAYAYVRLGECTGLPAESHGTDSRLPTIDMDLCDPEGNVCVSIRGMTLDRPTLPDAYPDASGPAANGAQEAPATPDAALPPAEAPQELLFAEAWEEMLPEPRSPAAEPSLLFIDEEIRAQLHADPESASPDGKILVLPGDGFRKLSEREFQARPGSPDDLRLVLASACPESGPPVSILYAWAKGKGRQGIHELMQLFRVLREAKSPVREIILAGRYAENDPATCWDYSWIGFERSLVMHFPSLHISVLLSDDAASLPRQVREVSGRSGIYWYRRGKGQKLAIRALEQTDTAHAPLLKQNGAYLITGGAGALGYHFARHLAAQYGARLLLIGRSALSPQLEEKLADLRAAGASEAKYLSLDLGGAFNAPNEEAVREFARQIPFPISGVFHAAGIESPKFFHEKSEREIDAVLAPKTTGTLLLDEALAGHPLDFVSYFSSTSAILGDGGACDYAVANRFLMAHASYRERQADKRGKTAVINWPLWKDGGMGIPDPAKLDFYLKSSGQVLLEKDTGVRIWHDLLGSKASQALLLIGDAKRLTNAVQRFYQPKQALFQAARPSAASVGAAGAAAEATVGRGWKPQFEGLAQRDCILWDVKRLVSAQLRIGVERLDIEAILTDYGFESIGLAEFAQRLSEHFAVQVTPDVFFTYTTMAQLADYFRENHAAAIAVFYQRPEGKQSGARPETPSSATPSLPASSPRRKSPAPAPKKSPFRKTGRADDRIAIVGMSGRFPGARNVDDLWTLLIEGKSAMQEVPPERWDWREYFKGPGHPGNTTSTNKGGFISGVEEFDAAFFGFGREEADWTDPGQRLLLMEAYRAIEDAGIRPSSLRGKKIGVYVGMEESQYGLLADGLTNQHLMATNGNAMISSRLSYCLDLRGPAISVNTACSSGLVALHQAAMGIRNGDCEAALVGAIALLLTPATFIAMGATGMLSPDGLCHSLGNRDDGMGMGEAVAVVMLKPLASALADGDNIYGVLRASGINFDGKTNGITAPNGRAQSDLFETVYQSNGIPIASLDVLATHSTGTKLGDSIELNALGRAMRNLAGEAGPKRPEDPGSCVLTCNKGNLGHTLAASGLVSVISLLKGMRNRAIPASLNCETENEYVAWKEMPFRINKAIHPWAVDSDRPRLAGASSFGRSGTNAHVVVEEYGPVRQTVRSYERVLIPLSAKTPAALEEKIRDLARFLKRMQDPETLAADGTFPSAFELAEIACTLQLGRDPLDERAAIAADSLADLIAKLEGYGADSGAAAGWHRANAKEQRQTLSLLTEDAAIQNTVIEKWIQDGNFARLLDSWTKGMEIDWTRLYAGIPPRKISLPGYSFARNRHWIDRPQLPAAAAVANGQTIRSSATQDPAPIPTPAPAPAPAAPSVKTAYLFLKAGQKAGQPVLELDVQGKAELFVKQTLADRLGIDPDSLDLDSEMSDTGITSKDMVQITMDIKDRIDPAFVPTAFFDCTTTRSFAHVLAAKNPSAFRELTVCRSGSASAEPARGNEASGRPHAAIPEANGKPGRDAKPAGPSLPLHVQDAAAWEKIDLPQDLPRDWSNPRAILLTGATGYLGIHLLAELLHAKEDLRVYCLVRAEDAGKGLERILAKARMFRLQLDTDRIGVFCGDITRPDLGLAEAEWEFCCREIQQIVHSSAHVNHIEGYAPFRPSTQGMREVIRLAGLRRVKLIHFISSIAACTFFDGKQVSIHEKEEFIDDGQAVFGGYGQSKWVQETLLRNAHSQGLPFMIYRFGELGGSSRTGLAQTEDMVHRLVQMRLSLGVREKISNDVLDMLPVDFAARVVARACNTEDIRNKILHATHPRPCPIATFYAFAQKQGYAFQPVSRAEYQAKCLDYIRYVASFNPVDAFILECVVMREVIGLARNMRAMDGYFVILFPFDQANFLECLAAEGLELPPWEDLLERLFRNWNGIDRDFFERILGFSKWQETQDEELCGPKMGLISARPEGVV